MVCFCTVYLYGTGRLGVLIRDRQFHSRCHFIPFHPFFKLSVGLRAMTKRSFGVIISALVFFLSKAALADNSPFTIVILPDTQYYSALYPAIFTSQTQWIVNNLVGQNIAFVLHEGDLTNSNIDAEWQNASASMGILDGVVPYAVVPGNHDYCAVPASCGTPPTRLFNQYFPPSRYAGSPNFGGVFEAGKLDNTYSLFTAGGTDWVVIAVSLRKFENARSSAPRSKCQRQIASPNSLSINCSCASGSPWLTHLARPLRIMWTASIPCNVRHAVENDWYPLASQTRFFETRWSCSITLFKYLQWRS